MENGTDNLSDYNTIGLVTLNGWALPFRNDIEDTCSYVCCSDSHYIDSVDSRFHIEDSFSFDQEVLNIDIAETLNYKIIKKLHRAMWHAKPEQLQKWLIRKP